MNLHVRIPAVAMTLALLASGVTARALGAGEEPSREERDRAMERVEMMRMWRMTEDLNLTEEEGTALFPALREIEADRRVLNRERGETMRELRSTLRGEHPDLDATRTLLDRLEKNREKSRRLDDREYDRVKSLLDVERLGRYLLFQRDFEREIREVILRSGRPGPPRGGAEGRPRRATDRPPPLDRPHR